MYINFKNYNEEDINKYIIKNNNEKIDKLLTTININLPYLIEYLKEEEKLSPTKDFKINIIFENFNIFTDFLQDIK